MSYEGFDKKIKNETIFLTHIPEKTNKSFSDDDYEYISPWENKGKKEKTKEEIKKEKLKQKEESQKLYYKIEENKNKELEKFFKRSKLKVSLSNIQFLSIEQICTKSEKKFLIYDNKNFNKLFEIQFENIDNIKSVIELDNKDLIFFSIINKKKQYWNYEYELLIYRLKDKNYSFIQKIKEDRTGYAMQDDYRGCKVFSKTFSLDKIEKLSGNRFMSISNYGIKMYSLNNKNQYSLVLLDTHLEGIEKIYEINENKLIFCTKKRYGASLGGPSHDYLLIEKVDIKKIGSEEIAQKINEIKNETGEYFFYEEKMKKLM